MSSGYVCRTCGYVPSRDEASAGTCPQCFVERREDELTALIEKRDAARERLGTSKYPLAYDDEIARLERIIDNCYSRMEGY